MNQRQRAFQQGLSAIRRQSARGRGVDNRSITRGVTGAIRPKLYTAAGMPELNQIVAGDSIKLLNDGPEGWVDLVFADPPFNIGYLYDGYNDRRKAEEYVNFSRDWMQAVHRALTATGSFYLAIGDDYAAELCVEAKKVGFFLRNWIIWHYTFGQQPKRKFARSHTHILYFTKHPTEFTFNPDAIRVASARQTTYGDARANPKGKLPDDVWFLRPQEASAADEQFFNGESDTWNVSRVCGTFKEREGWHGCQMPIGVLNRIILASSNPNDVVLDPFNGSGTTTVAAALLGRRYVGIDQSQEYVDYARKRLAHAQENAPLLSSVAAIVSDPTRASRRQTETDAFGRKRVPRGPRAKRTA
jgi:DNA modification methylase